MYCLYVRSGFEKLTKQLSNDQSDRYWLDYGSGRVDHWCHPYLAYFRIAFVSNSALTPTEFEKWKYTCETHNITLPTRDFIQSKHDEIKKGLNFEYTSADIDKIIEKKEKFKKNPVNYAMKKAKLMKDKEIATAEHDIEKANEIEQQLQVMSKW